MINLEWLRTFRAVYRSKSLSRASELLNISQPTVSQHIQALEAHVGQKLFTRRSKGVEETDDGKILNTLVAGSIESLEEAENVIADRYTKKILTLTIGISEHLYKSMLCHKILELGKNVHVKFGTRNSLITDVEEGRLLYAIVPGEQSTFDIISHPLFKQNLILVSTPDIDLSDLPKLYKKDKRQAEQLLVEQTWYAHNTASSYIKLLWLNAFNKKRPAVIPNYVIPNEYEVLQQLSNGSGLSVALDTNAAPFIKDGSLVAWKLKKVDFRMLSLLANKKKAPKEMTASLLKMLGKR